MQSRNENLKKWTDFILAPLIIFFSMYSPYFASGGILSLDEGVHLASINELLKGSILFRDIYSMHGPLLVYIPYWLMKLFGVNLAVLRGFYLFGNILSLLLAFILLRVLVSNYILKYCALFFILRFPFELFWIVKWGGIRWAPGFIALLLLYYWLRHMKRWYLLSAGLTCGIGLLVSQEIGLIVGCSVATAIILRSLEHRKDGCFARMLIRNASLFALGFALVAVPFIAYLLLHDIFMEYLKIQFVDTMFLLPKRMPYGRSFAGPAELFSPSKDMQMLARRTLAFYGMVLVSSGIFIWAIFNYRKRPLNRMIFLISLAVYSAISMKAATRDLQGPQFNSILPIFFITLAMFLEMWLESGSESSAERNEEPHRRARLKRFVPLSALLVAILLCGNSLSFFSQRLSLMWYLPNARRVYPGTGLNADTVPRAKGTKLYPMSASELSNVVGFLKTHTAEDDRIYTFPTEGHINFLADRQSASRFTIAIFSKIRDEYMEEVIRDLESDQTKYIVYCPGDYEILDIPNEQRIEPVWKYIQSKYMVLKKYGNMNILVRTELSPPMAPVIGSIPN